jgi:hypothetical protein
VCACVCAPVCVGVCVCVRVRAHVCRFESLSGQFNPDMFEKAYSFVGQKREEEIKCVLPTSFPPHYL